MLAFDRKRQSLNFQRDDVDDESFTIRIVDEYRQLAAMWRYRTERLSELVGPVSSPPAG